MVFLSFLFFQSLVLACLGSSSGTVAPVFSPLEKKHAVDNTGVF